MVENLSQFNIKVQPELDRGFRVFCERAGVRPYRFLVDLVSAYGRCGLLLERMDSNEMTRSEVLSELGDLTRDMQKMARVNGEFRSAVIKGGGELGIDLSGIDQSEGIIDG